MFTCSSATRDQNTLSAVNKSNIPPIIFPTFTVALFCKNSALAFLFLFFLLYNFAA